MIPPRRRSIGLNPTEASKSLPILRGTEISNPFPSSGESAANSDNRLHSGDTGDKIRGATLVDQRTDPALGGAGISLIDEIALGKYVAELADCLEPRWAAPVGAQTPATRLATELDRHKGQLLLLQGHSEAAEELYRK